MKLKKSLWQILVILAAALIVTGGLKLWQQYGTSATAAGQLPGERFPEERRGERPPEGEGRVEFPGERGGPDRGRGDFAPGIFGVAGFLKTLLPITVIVLGFAAGDRLISRFRRSRRRAEPAGTDVNPG